MRLSIQRPLAVLMAVLSVSAASQAVAQWTAPVNISNTPGVFSTNTSFDFDSAGRVHVVWEDFLDTYHRVYYANNVSGAWQASGIVDGALSPRVCITPDQVMHVFYKYNSRMWEITRPVSGGSWTAPVQLDTYASGGWVSDAVVDGSGGIYFAWLHLFDDTMSPPSAVWGRYKPFGGTWGPVELIAYGGREDFPAGFNLTAHGSRIYGCYDLYDQPRYKIYENGSWGPQRTAAAKGGGCRIAFAPNGEMAVAYGYDPPGDAEWYQVYVKFSHDDGATWTPEVNISNGPWLNRSPEICYDANSNLHVVYQRKDSDPVQFDMYYISRIGGLWQSQSVLSSPQNLRAGSPTHAIRAYGNDLYFTYSETLDGFEEVYFRMKPGVNPDPPAAPTDFTAAPGEERAQLSWRNPSGQYYAATMVRVSTSGYPDSPFSGTYVCLKQALPGSTDSQLAYPLTAGVPQYFSAFAQDAVGQWSPAAHAATVPLANTTRPGSVTNFSVSVPAHTGQLVLAWTNPADMDLNSTVVRCGTSAYPSSPTDGFLVCDRTAAPGLSDSFTHTGLTPGVRYYYTAFARDTASNYADGVTGSAVALAATCGVVKQMTDGTPATLEDKVVSANFASTDGCIYVQEPDRSSGIRVNCTDAALAVGDRVNVTGALATRVLSNQPSERYVTSATVAKVSSGAAPGPLAVTCRALGGGPNGLAPGVRDGVGINSMGLLVKITGTVTYKSGQYIYIDDGSNIENLYGLSTSVTGVMVKCPSSSVPAQVGDVVAVAGVVEGSVPSNAAWTTNRSYLHMRTFDDLTLIVYTPTAGTISGTVKDAGGTGLVGAVVSASTGGYSTTTTTGGAYSLSNVAAGTYGVTASKSGYASQTVSNVNVQVGQTTNVNFSLASVLTQKLTNGDFEGGFFNSGWYGGWCANGWGFAWKGSPSNNSFYCNSYNAGYPHSTVHLVQGKVDNFEVGIAQEITGLTPASDYTFSAECYKTCGSYNTYIAVRDGVGYNSNMGTTAGTPFPSTAGAWVSQQVTGTVSSSGSVTVYLWVKRLSGATADIYFDNASFMGR